MRVQQRAQVQQQVQVQQQELLQLARRQRRVRQELQQELHPGQTPASANANLFRCMKTSPYYGFPKGSRSRGNGS